MKVEVCAWKESDFLGLGDSGGDEELNEVQECTRGRMSPGWPEKGLKEWGQITGSQALLTYFVTARSRDRGARVHSDVRKQEGPFPLRRSCGSAVMMVMMTFVEFYLGRFYSAKHLFLMNWVFVVAVLMGLVG